VSSTDPRLLALLDEPVPRALGATAGGISAHLVGGVVRDRLLGIAGSDFDAVVAAGGPKIARRLARDLPARLVNLGGTRFAAYRLVGAGFVLDLWDREGQSLQQDLARRDFTVNALALDLANRRLVDPFEGRADLAHRRLRATTSGVFADDPLRVLRLVRLALQLPGFRAEHATVALAGAASGGLAGVAAERVRAELTAILQSIRFGAGLSLLRELDLYPGLLRGRPGEPGDGQPADRLTARLEPALDHLRQLGELPHGRLEPAGPRLAVLFEGLGARPSEAETALESCRRTGYLTGREAARCRRLLGCRETPGTEPAARWFLHRWGGEWPAAAATLAALAEPVPAAASWRQLVGDLIALAQREAATIFAPPPLLGGDEIRELLGLEPGPPVGLAVARLRRAQIEGRVSDRAGAAALLRSSASTAD
jgi:tRNA nucleotidyltransferase/poly(A) polymerase